MKRAVITGFLLAVVLLTGAALWSQYQRADSAATVKAAVEAGITDDVQTLERLKLERQQEHERLEIAKIKDRQQAIPFNRRLTQSVSIGVATSAVLSLLILAGAYRRKILTHVLKIGVNEIPVKDKDLSRLAPEVSTSLALAQTIEAQAPQKAVELYLALADVNTKQLKALAGRIPQIPRELRMQDTLRLNAAPVSVPSFADLLTSRQIGPRTDLVFGVQDSGELARGTWQDLYSSAIAGQSGNGKSSTARSLILQSLLSGEIAAFYLCDPHRRKPEGLVNSLGPLVDLPNVIYNVSDFDLAHPVQAFSARMDARIAGHESCDRPIVLVIDELLTVINIVPGADAVVKRIGTQGRGFGCYGLFLAQSWVGSEVGGTSTRDNLTSLLVHRMKKKQANTLLQNPDWSKVASGLKPGEVVFEPTTADPQKLSIPLCTPADARTVYDMLVDGNTIRTSGSRPVRVDPDIDTFFEPLSTSQRPDTKTHTRAGPDAPQAPIDNVVKFERNPQGTPVPSGDPPSPALVLQLLKANCEASAMTKTDWIQDFSSRAGISASLLKLILLGRRNITPETITKVSPYLCTDA